MCCFMFFGSFFLWIRTSFVLMTKSWNISTKLWFWAASLIIKCVIHVLSHVCTWELGLLVSPWWWTERTAVAGSHWTQAHLWGWSWSEQFQLCRCWIGRSTGLQLLARELWSPLGRSDLCRERRWTGYRQKKKWGESKRQIDLVGFKKENLQLLSPAPVTFPMM